MKKYLLAVTVLSLTILMFSGCRNKSNDTSSNETATATIAETENTTEAITIPLDESENSKQLEEVYIPTYKTSDENGNPIILENNVPNDAYARN